MTATVLAADLAAQAREVLTAPASTLVQLLGAIATLEQQPPERTVRIGVSSSVTVDLLGTYLRRHGFLAGAGVEVVAGGYDDPIGDVERFREAGVEHVLLLPFFDNLLPSFEAQLPTLPPSAVDALEDRLRTRYRLALENAREVPTVSLCTFSRMGAAADAGGRDVVAQVLDRFNAGLREEAAAFANTRLIDTEDIVRTVGRPAAFDARFYYRSKAPWTGAFLDELARRVAVAARGFGAHFYKVLALDCDNTLWGGVVGEDSLTGIRLDPHDHPGNIFWRVQHEIAALRRRGVLLCLVTKNNPEDVEEVLRAHPDTVLRPEDFVATKVNWDDKSSNLRALAAELGLGLDSIVFLDDSPFECEAVRAQLPMVRTVQVPKTLSDYPRVLAEIGELFPPGTGAAVDKTEQYVQRAHAQQLQARSVDHESYLASLQLAVELRRDVAEDAPRVSELSQKSNQFNLTTRRYGVGEVQGLMDNPDRAVWSVVVGDTFGSAGLTGAVVLSYDGTCAHVENFFLSCRILGRGIETALWPTLVADVAARGCTELRTQFRPTPKNGQVADFYDRLGFRVVAEAADGSRTYAIGTSEFTTPSPAWIEITHVG